MKAPAKGTQGKVSKASQESSEMMEGSELKASVVNSQSKLRMVYQETASVRKEVRMKTVMGINRVNICLSKGLPVRTAAASDANLCLEGFIISPSDGYGCPGSFLPGHQ